MGLTARLIFLRTSLHSTLMAQLFNWNEQHRIWSTPNQCVVLHMDKLLIFNTYDPGNVSEQHCLNSQMT